MITFSGSVNIKQIGHAIIHLDKYNEDYLIPLPHVRVSGLLTGTPYPELTGSYQIVSSTGYVAEIDFTGKKMFGLSGKKNQFHAGLYKQSDEKRKDPLYEAEGSWNEEFTIRDTTNKKDIETFNTNNQKPTKLVVPPLEQQDPWESRRAWAGVIDALNHGNMQATSDAKSKVEKAQREMRKKEEASNQTWKPKFFVKTDRDETFQKLAAVTHGQHEEDQAHGFWKFNLQEFQNAQKPYHGELRPDQA